jgi:type IV pilus assembly protein PilO
MKAPAMPSIDFKVILEDFRTLNPKDVGAWPVVPRVTILLTGFVVMLVAGWWFLWSDQLDVLEAAKKNEVKLKDEFLA